MGRVRKWRANPGLQHSGFLEHSWMGKFIIVCTGVWGGMGRLLGESCGHVVWQSVTVINKDWWGRIGAGGNTALIVQHEINPCLSKEQVVCFVFFSFFSCVFIFMFIWKTFSVSPGGPWTHFVHKVETELLFFPVFPSTRRNGISVPSPVLCQAPTFLF